MKDDLISARLDLIAAKARILAGQYKNGQLWGGELNRQLNDIESEIRLVTQEGSGRGPVSTGGTWYPDDK